MQLSEFSTYFRFGRLAGVTVSMLDLRSKGSTPGQIAIKWLLHGLATVCKPI